MKVAQTALQIAIDDLVDKDDMIDNNDFAITKDFVRIAESTGKSGSEKKAMVLEAIKNFGLALVGFVANVAVELAVRWLNEERKKAAHDNQ
jgi:hypothetical protein